MNEHVLWTDVAPRDGLQNIATSVSTDAKVRLVRGLLDAGAPRGGATPLVSPRWVPPAPCLIPNLRVFALALEHGVRNVLVTIGPTETLNRRNVNRSVGESLEDL